MDNQFIFKYSWETLVVLSTALALGTAVMVTATTLVCKVKKGGLGGEKNGLAKKMILFCLKLNRREVRMVLAHQLTPNLRHPHFRCRREIFPRVSFLLLKQSLPHSRHTLYIIYICGFTSEKWFLANGDRLYEHLWAVVFRSTI